MADQIYFDINPGTRLKFAANLPQIQKGPVLHLGASRLPMNAPDRIIHNHDWRHNPGIDLVFDLMKTPWPIQSNTYASVVTFHCLEHIPIHEVLPVVQEAHRVMMPGGIFITEVPDIDGVLQEYIDGNVGMLENIYGHDRHPGDQHRWGYTRSSMQLLLTLAGFDRTTTCDPRCYHREQQACLRAEATKYKASPEIELEVKSEDSEAAEDVSDLREYSARTVPGPGLHTSRQQLPEPAPAT